MQYFVKSGSVPFNELAFVCLCNSMCVFLVLLLTCFPRYAEMHFYVIFRVMHFECIKLVGCHVHVHTYFKTHVCIHKVFY